jgi:carbon monoxide dehydrogenase subunit G
MRASSSVTVPAPIDRVVPHLGDLAGYPQWMPIIHSISRDDDGDETAWSVELRAKVGPFARSKRLRMVRTVNEMSDDSASFVFDRRERGGAVHSVWRMSVEVRSKGDGTDVSIDLEYGGALWTAGVLDRVLAGNIDAGKAGLIRVVTAQTQ